MSDRPALLRLAQYLSNADPDMTISRLVVFATVAQKKQCLVSDLVAATGLNQATISRILALLSDGPNRGKQQGLGWVRSDPDPADTRRHIVSVTPKGKRVLEELDLLNS